MTADRDPLAADVPVTEAVTDRPASGAIALELVPSARLEPWLAEQPEATRRWVRASRFTGKPGTHCLLPGPSGDVERVAVGSEANPGPFTCAHLPSSLAEGVYHFGGAVPVAAEERMALGWCLGTYAFTRFKGPAGEPQPGLPRPVLALSDGVSLRAVRDQAAGIALTRDLVNTPPDHMMPEHLSEAASALARQYRGTCREVVGEDLLTEGFPAIHAVGRASVHPPRLIDLVWGRPDHPKLTLVGKGVCFDSGGLDLKSAAGMRLMKKDMGGAAHALGLARMVMGSELPVRLRVLIPAVENAVSGSAYHPGDVVPSRAGISIEIDNTDAEGRVVLSDGLAEGGAESPELMLDFATLTGAARVALGTDLPAFFTNDDALAAALTTHGAVETDPVWRMPLHAPYRELIDSRVADIMNSGASPHGGAITAALFLERFVPEGVAWGHFDIMAWNSKSRPGRPEGGEAMALRALFAYLRARYPAS